MLIETRQSDMWMKETAIEVAKVEFGDVQVRVVLEG